MLSHGFTIVMLTNQKIVTKLLLAKSDFKRKIIVVIPMPVYLQLNNMMLKIKFQPFKNEVDNY